MRRRAPGAAGGPGRGTPHARARLSGRCRGGGGAQPLHDRAPDTVRPLQPGSEPGAGGARLRRADPEHAPRPGGAGHRTALRSYRQSPLRYYATSGCSTLESLSDPAFANSVGLELAQAAATRSTLGPAHGCRGAAAIRTWPPRWRGRVAIASSHRRSLIAARGLPGYTTAVV